MEIAKLNLISDFEAGIKCLQNPSLISKLPQLYSFWTYGALIIAVFATFTNIFKKIKMFIHHIRLKLLLSYQNTCPQQIFDDDDFDFDFSDDGGSDDTPSSVAESDEDIEHSEDDGHGRGNEVFRAEGGGNYWNDEGHDGNFTLRRRNGFSWSDFSAGKSVVQLWDSFGLGLDFEDDENEIAIWDLDREVKLSSGRRVTAARGEETVVLTAEVDGGNGGVGFGTYDSRVDERSPAIYAAWRPRQRNVWVDGKEE
ncbi:hypothetical protein Hdeb2414_s0028g00700301 [Helianthus debilis subsp. tardiflorus]